MKTAPSLLLSVAACALTSAVALAQDFDLGQPNIRAMSCLAFDPNGVLFVGDSKSGAVFALDMAPGEPPSDAANVAMTDVEARLAARLGTSAGEVMIHDLAVHPINRKVFLAVSRGRSGWSDRWQLPNEVADADVLLTIDAEGNIEESALDEAAFVRVELPNPVDADKQHPWKAGAKLRSDTITDMAWVDGTLFVTGLSNEEFASTLWRVPFPALGGAEGDVTATTLEIYHGAHGAYETHAPIRTFVPFEAAGEAQILAAYLCTPLVTFPAGDLEAGAHVKGRTLAELGSGNYPLDMVSYTTGGRDRVLIANSNLPLMVIEAADIAAFEGEINAKPEGYLAGVPYEPRSGSGILQLEVLDPEHFVALQRMPGGTLDLVVLPAARF